MKTKVTFITAALFLVSFFGFALEFPGEEFQKKDTMQQTFDIRINKDNLVVLRASSISDKRRSFIVKVYSEKGSLLYASTYIRKGDALIPFDISKFPKGKYTFNVYKGFTKVYRKEILKNLNIRNQDILVEIKK
ncbi:MAG: hypothetical protein DRJ10_07290 [Bacteroidetes bacterium]|nr:MAG: hypothetical protein DRJ10_07290 [Bacteroidota bacterium]